MTGEEQTRISGKRVVIPLVATTIVVAVVFLIIQFSGRGTAARNAMILHYTAGLRDLDEHYYRSAVHNLTPVVESGAEPAAYGFRGEAYLKLKDYAKAEADFRQAVRREPALPANHAGLGIALVLQGRPAEALPHLQRAAELLEAPHPPAPGKISRSGDTLDAVFEWKRRAEQAPRLSEKP